MAAGHILLMVVFPRTGTAPSNRSESRAGSGGFFEEMEMNLANLLTLQALNVTLVVRQAQRELNAAIVLAEIALREQAQKNRPARERRAA
jgi:hypothetical protein